jgi:hypothetical protein
MIVVARFAEDLPVKHDHGVGAQNKISAECGGHM